MNYIFILIYVSFLTSFSQSAKLEIYANGVIVKETYSTKERDFLQLTCKLVDNNAAHHTEVSIEWRGPQSARNIQNHIKEYLNANEATLNISSLQKTDTGGYICVCKELNLTADVWLNVKFHILSFYCSDNMFICDKSEICIPQPYVCDGHVDCKYGEDEHVRKCGSDPCHGKIRNCRDGRCIPSKWCCDSDLDTNCTIKEKPSCCQQQVKLFQEQASTYDDYDSFKHGLMKATIFTLFVGAVLFFFVISILLLVFCRIHIHSCPANQDIREVWSRTRIPFYDFYLYLNRNWSNLDHSYMHRPSMRDSPPYIPTRRNLSPLDRSQILNDTFDMSNESLPSNHRTIPHSILFMSYLNNEVQYVHRPNFPPPYSEIGEQNPLQTEPPPPYVSRENLTETENRRGYILLTSNSNTESDAERNIEPVNTSCALNNNIVENSSPATPVLVNLSSRLVTNNRIYKDSGENTAGCSTRSTEPRKKYDLKKLRQEFLGATVAMDRSDSESSISELNALLAKDCSCVVFTNDVEATEFFTPKNSNDLLFKLNEDSGATTSSLKLRETHVDESKGDSKKKRPRSFNCDRYLFASHTGSNPVLEVGVSPLLNRRDIPLIKCNSGTIRGEPTSNNSLSHADDDEFSKYFRRANAGRFLRTRHSIADLSPSSSNAYRNFETPEYCDRDSLMLTLPLRESFIGLRNE